MPLKSGALIIVAFFFKSCNSWMDVRYRSSSSDGIPAVLGCRLFEREDNLGLSAFCNSFEIPETSSSLPNSTIKLQIYGVSNLDVSRPVLNHLFNLRELELPKNDLKDFDSGILEGLANLRSLSLKDNNIKKLQGDTFVHNPLLEKIDLSGNLIISVLAVTHCLKTLMNLNEINLANNMIISSLTFADFSPLQNTSLRSLLMAGCPIDRIDQDAFRSLKISALDLSFTLLDATAVGNITQSLEFAGLQSLKMSNLRRLHSFPVQFFRSLNMPSVEEIDISFNRFVDISLNGNLYPALKFLDMTACNLQDGNIPFGSFSATPNLETLVLKRNLISAVRQQLSPLTKLKKLDISDPMVVSQKVRIFTIEDYAFQNLTSLEYLSLEGQPIRRGITRYTFNGLAGLTHLKLSRCVIRIIEEYAFETLRSLEILDFQANLIENLDNYTFYGLRNVKSINLKKNSLITLNRSNPFQHTPALETVVLNDNKINQLFPGIFDGLLHLGIIRLANNFIIPWHKRVLPQHGNVSYLEISKNRISYFSPEMLADVRYLETLDFSYNPLNCAACGMSDVQLWMRNTSTDIYFLHENNSLPYACVEPPELANVSVLDAQIPVAHCVPEELDVVLLSLSTVVPVFSCIFLASIVWYFFAWHIKYCCFSVKAKVRVYKGIAKSDRYMYDAFVSYSPSDVLWIRNCLVPALEGGDHGYRLCIPDRNFEAAVNITDNVFHAVQNSRTTILVLSNAYLESEWCKFDMDVAQHKLFEDTRSLILILLEELESSKMTKNLKYIIRTRTFIPWTNNPTGQRLFWERLRLAVARPVQRVLLKHIT